MEKYSVLKGKYFRCMIWDNYGTRLGDPSSITVSAVIVLLWEMSCESAQNRERIKRLPEVK
jgi:hypothetical protein